MVDSMRILFNQTLSLIPTQQQENITPNMPDEYNVKKKKLSFKGETKTYRDTYTLKEHAMPTKGLNRN